MDYTTADCVVGQDHPEQGRCDGPVLIRRVEHADGSMVVVTCTGHRGQ